MSAEGCLMLCEFVYFGGRGGGFLHCLCVCLKGWGLQWRQVERGEEEKGSYQPRGSQVEVVRIILLEVLRFPPPSSNHPPPSASCIQKPPQDQVICIRVKKGTKRAGQVVLANRHTEEGADSETANYYTASEYTHTPTHTHTRLWL